MSVTSASGQLKSPATREKRLSALASLRSRCGRRKGSSRGSRTDGNLVSRLAGGHRRESTLRAAGAEGLIWLGGRLFGAETQVPVSWTGTALPEEEGGGVGWGVDF